eukprot:scaffold51154_cov58-Cyclotella_meneghiniana.AAC.5
MLGFYSDASDEMILDVLFHRTTTNRQWECPCERQNGSGSACSCILHTGSRLKVVAFVDVDS